MSALDDVGDELATALTEASPTTCVVIGVAAAAVVAAFWAARRAQRS